MDTSSPGGGGGRRPATVEMAEHLLVPEAEDELAERLQKDGGLADVQNLEDVLQHALPQSVGLEEQARELCRHGGRRLLRDLPALPELARRPLREARLDMPVQLDDLRDPPPQAALYLPHLRREPRRGVLPGVGERRRGHAGDGRAAALPVAAEEEGAQEVDEDGGMEVSEPEEGPLDGVAPRGAENLGHVLGGGPVEGLEVGLEVVVDALNLHGEEAGGRNHGAGDPRDRRCRRRGPSEGGGAGGHCLPEEREERVLEGPEPLVVEALEGVRRLLLLGPVPSCPGGSP